MQLEQWDDDTNQMRQTTNIANQFWSKKFECDIGDFVDRSPSQENSYANSPLRRRKSHLSKERPSKLIASIASQSRENQSKLVIGPSVRKSPEFAPAVPVPQPSPRMSSLVDPREKACTPLSPGLFGPTIKPTAININHNEIQEE